MKRITTALETHHKSCDDYFAAADDAARHQDWVACAAALRAFREALEAHFGIEEEALFPAFEQRTGMAGGPTQVMRMEHGQMRTLADELNQALQRRDADAFAGTAETLLIMLQQHNLKEENILYPMCDRALAQDGNSLRQRIDAALETRVTI